MRAAPLDVAVPVGTFNAPLCGWHCFHCGEEFSVAKQKSFAKAIEAATEHFGPDARWTPACLELLALKPQQIYRRMRRAEIQVAAMAHDAEELDDLRTQNAEEAHEVIRLRNLVDSLQGELETARSVR